MEDNAGPIVQESRLGRVQAPMLSPRDFRMLVRELLGAVRLARHEIEQVQQLFSHAVGVRPVECDTAVLVLRHLQPLIRQLYNLLAGSSSPSLDVLRHRYDLLAPLHAADSQVRQQEVYLTLFRSVCLDASPYVVMQRQTIAAKLEKLAGTCAEIETQGRMLMDRSYW